MHSTITITHCLLSERLRTRKNGRHPIGETLWRRRRGGHRALPVGISRRKAQRKHGPTAVIGLLPRNQRRQGRNRGTMESPPTILAPQATALENPWVLKQLVAVGTRRPKVRRSWRPRRIRILVRSLFFFDLNSYILVDVDGFLTGTASAAVSSSRGKNHRRGVLPSRRRARLLAVRRRTDQIDPGEEAKLLVKAGLLGAVGEDGPGVSDELEGGVGVGEAVLVGVEEEGEASVLLFYEIEVATAAVDLKNSVPVVVAVVVDALLGGEEDVGDSEDLVGSVEEGLRFLGEKGEFPAAAQITSMKLFLCDSDESLRLDFGCSRRGGRGGRASSATASGEGGNGEELPRRHFRLLSEIGRAHV